MKHKSFVKVFQLLSSTVVLFLSALAFFELAFRADLYMLVSPELCPSIDGFNSTLQSVLEKHVPLCRRKVRSDRLESRGTQMSKMNLKLLRSTTLG